MDNKEFLHYVNSLNEQYEPALSSAPADLRDILRREIPFNDIYPILSAAKHSNINIKEIILESEIDFVKSAQNLKSVFDTQLSETIDKLNECYQRELTEINIALRQQVFGNKLLQLINTLNENEFTLIMMNKRVYAYRCYSPEYDVTQGCFKSGLIYEYDEPVCSIRGIYVNLLHPKFMNGTVLLATEDRHPNASSAGLSEACIGDLEDKPIPITDPDALVQLLEEVCAMYEVCHLDSAYFTPEQSYKTKQGSMNKWTA